MKLNKTTIQILKLILITSIFNLAVSFEVKRAIISHKNYKIDFIDYPRQFSISREHSSEKIQISGDGQTLLEVDTATQSTKIPVKVNTHRLQVQARNPSTFYLWRGGLLMSTRPKPQVDEGTGAEPESVPAASLTSIRKYVSGEFSELRCARESRAAIVIEKSAQFFEIDVGGILDEANEEASNGTENSQTNAQPHQVRVEMVLDFYDEWEDDSLYLIQKNGRYLFQSNFKNCKGSVSKADCKKQLRDVCRQDKPDSLGHTQVFTFLYDPAQELKLKISISQDEMAKRPDQEAEDSHFAFGLGLYALFVYRK